MPRLILTDELCSKLKTILLKDRVYNKLEYRQTLEGIFYRLHIDCPCSDVLECFGCRVPFIVVYFFGQEKAY